MSQDSAPSDSATDDALTAGPGEQVAEQVDEKVDASWWDSVTDSQDAADFEPAEVLHEQLRRLAQIAQADAGETSLQARTLTAMARATSAQLDPDSWNEPFSPAVIRGSSRSVIPSDMTSEELALLASVMPLIEPPVLRARIADVVWTYRFPRDPGAALIATDAYLAVPLTWEAWTRSGRDSYRRVIELARRLGDSGAAPLQRATSTLIAFLSGNRGSSYHQAQVSQVLRATGKVGPEQARLLAQHLADLGDRTPGGTRPERALLREAASWWYRGQRDQEAMACQVRVADSYAAECEAQIARNRPAVAATRALEKSLDTLRTLPRKYRSTHDLDDVITQRQSRLRELREDTLEEMTALAHDTVDFSEAIRAARRHVSGRARESALVALTQVSPLLAVAEETVAVSEELAGAITRLMSRSTYSSDGRKVSVSAGDPSAAPSEQEIIDELVRRNSVRVGLVVQGLIFPALETLRVEHRFDLLFLETTCRESATVPVRHAGLWARGLWHGLNGDFPSSVSLLVPQIEQMVRLQLKARGVHTLFIGERGVESEKALGSLLETEEAKAFLGEDLAFELRALLVEQVGPNLRNELAHGLETDATLYGAASVYAWWLCLRMVLAGCDIADGADEAGTEGEGDTDGSEGQR